MSNRTIEDIIKIIKTKKFNYNNFLTDNDKEIIVKATSFLPSDASLKERIYCLLHNIKERPKCQYCGENYVKYLPNKRRYAKYCCKECQIKGSKEKMRQTMLERYGVDVPMKSEKIKEKVKQTLFEKYGVDVPMKNEKIKQKYKQTIKERYGVEWNFQIDKVKEKIEKTNLKRYGVKCACQSDIIKEKIRKTNLKRYGVECILKTNQVKKKVLEKYGVEKWSDLPFLGKASKIKKERNKEAFLKEIEKDFVVLNKEEYNGVCDSILKLQCKKCGYIFDFRLILKYNRKYICPNCKKLLREKTRKKMYQIIKESFEKENYVLLTKEEEFENTKKTYLEYICPNGHKHRIKWSGWQSGNRCPYCKGLIVDYKFVKQSFENEGYTLLTKQYVNCMQKLEYICPNGHRHKVTWHNWKQGTRCPFCIEAHISKEEKEVLRFVRENYDGLIKENDRELLNGYEIDILLPELKLGIEFCGLYWHSELIGIKRTYHLEKLEKCLQKSVNLITIFEDEWYNQNPVVKSKLLLLLNRKDKFTKIHARKCDVSIIDSKIANDFLTKNHLQGSVKSFYNLGLLYNNELVAVMTFSLPSIAKGAKQIKDNVVELSRYCVKPYFLIPGAFSKLLKYFIKNNNNFEKIITYADRRWSNGKLYEKCGFKLVRVTEPNYWYINGLKRIHRFAFRKSVLKNKLKYFDKNLTEWENMVKNGWNRIWDCGNLKYELSV